MNVKNKNVFMKYEVKQYTKASLKNEVRAERCTGYNRVLGTT